MEKLMIASSNHIQKKGMPQGVPFDLDETNTAPNTFIEANTISSTLADIKENHIIPVFVKDNEPVISHAEFIESMITIVKDYFHGETILAPEIRISHPIKGRIPEARNKPAKELLEREKTLYYERMAFIIEIPSVSNVINGSRLNLTIGGVKAYNLDNLNTKSGAEQHFKLFCGFQNKVCTNMCVSSDGLVEDLKIRNTDQLNLSIQSLLGNYDGLAHLQMMESFTKYALTEKEFALLIGRCRMYKHLPEAEKAHIPLLLFGDNPINAVCKEYYRDAYFRRNTDNSISLWNLYNLFTGANRNTYIDLFLDKALNAYVLLQELKNAVQFKQESWYLN